MENANKNTQRQGTDLYFLMTVHRHEKSLSNITDPNTEHFKIAFQEHKKLGLMSIMHHVMGEESSLLKDCYVG